MTGKTRLSRIEQNVLGRLDQDAKASFSMIGKKIRTSEQRVSYTVNSLMKRGILFGFQTLIEYSRLDVLHFRVFFKVSYINQEKFRNLINYMRAEHHTMWVAACGGRYDLICTFAAFNPSQFNKLLRAIMAEFSDQLKNYTVLTTVVIRNFGRKYLLRGKTPTDNEVILGGDREPYQLDEKDILLLSEIADNARKTSVEIGKKISLTSKTVINRLRKLKNIRIVKGFRALLNLSDVGYTTTLLLIKYHNISLKEERKLLSYLTFHPYVVGFTKTLGEWDLEIKIEVKSERDFRKIDMEIRHNFSSLIQQTESVPLYRVHKSTYFPKFILEKYKS